MSIKIPEELVRQMHEFALTRDDFLAELLGDLLRRFDHNPPPFKTMDELLRHVEVLREQERTAASPETADAAASDDAEH